MKKDYIKPQIVFECFSLSMNIAECDNNVGSPTVDVCGFKDNRDPTGVPVFMDGISGCRRHEDDGYNGICYHNPSETTNLFNS